MRKGKFVCLVPFALALAAANTSMAQQSPQPTQQPILQPSPSTDIQRVADSYTRYQDDVQHLSRDMINLPKVRAHLTEVWQQLGMSAEDAQMVASAYTLDQAPSLYGKSDDEISSMIQSALAKKKYAWADQLVMSYERKKLFPEPGNSLVQSDH